MCNVMLLFTFFFPPTSLAETGTRYTYKGYSVSSDWKIKNKPLSFVTDCVLKQLTKMDAAQCQEFPSPSSSLENYHSIYLYLLLCPVRNRLKFFKTDVISLHSQLTASCCCCCAINLLAEKNNTTTKTTKSHCHRGNSFIITVHPPPPSSVVVVVVVAGLSYCW